MDLVADVPENQFQAILFLMAEIVFFATLLNG